MASASSARQHNDGDIHPARDDDFNESEHMQPADDALPDREMSSVALTTLNVFDAFRSEADAASEAGKSPRFVKAYEGAPFDAGMLINMNDLNDISPDPTSKLFELAEKFGSDEQEKIVLFDFKNLSWQRHRRAYAFGEGHLATASVFLSVEQSEKCAAIVISSNIDDTLVAVVPKPYFRVSSHIRRDSRVIGFDMGQIPHEMSQACPLPPVLAPFIMPKIFLAEALDNIAAKAENPAVQIGNPFTKMVYSRCSNWTPQAYPFKNLLNTANDSEFRIKRQIWAAFRLNKDISNIDVKNPTYAPLTGDLRLDYTKDGIVQLIFIEIKNSMSSVVKNGQGLSHEVAGRSGAGIFTFKAVWDWLFTVDRTANFGHLICKDDIPASVWHNTGANGSVEFDFPAGFDLKYHKVWLNQGPAKLYEDIHAILGGTTASTTPVPPRHAQLTARDIRQIAGPCPRRLLHGSRASIAEGLVDVQMEDVEAVSDAVLDDDDQHQTRKAGKVHRRVQGGPEMMRVYQLFGLLMDSSRTTGRGCPVFFGNLHAMSALGFVEFVWSDADKAKYDRTGSPPCWFGSLEDGTPVIPIFAQWSEWYIEYHPDEGTLGDIDEIRRIRPCLVVMTSYTKELSHARQQHWILPSEFVPEWSVGLAKGPEKPHDFKGPLFPQGHAVDELAVSVADVHATILRFFSCEENISIGYCGVQVDPLPYVKYIGDYRVNSDVDYELCFVQKTIKGAGMRRLPERP